jgi:hypothetical protein
MQLLNPYPDIRPDHPVLVRELRQMGWLERAGSPWRYVARRTLIIVTLVMVVFAAWMLFHWLRPARIYSSWWFSEAALNYLIIVGGLSLVASLPTDYASLTAALNSINGDTVTGTWDLLRLTEIREGELVLAKHAGAQLRAWRSMASVIGLRVAVALITVILFAHEYAGGTDRFGFEADAPLSYLVFNIVPFTVLFGIYIFEPLWRMRAVTALGLVVSSRSTDAAASALSGLGVLLAFWLVQLIVVAAVFVGTSVLFFSIALFGVGALCAPLVMLLVIFATVYGFYSILKTWSLRQVARRVVSYTR